MFQRDRPGRGLGADREPIVGVSYLQIEERENGGRPRTCPAPVARSWPGGNQATEIESVTETPSQSR